MFLPATDLTTVKHLSVNLYSTTYLDPGCDVIRLTKVDNLSFFLCPKALLVGSHDIPRPDVVCNPSIIFWVCPMVSFHLDVPGSLPEASRRHQIAWSTSENSFQFNFTQSSFCMFAVFILSLRLSPITTLWRKLISSTCIYELIRYVVTQRLWLL